MMLIAFIFLILISLITGFVIGHLVGFESGRTDELRKLLRLLNDTKTKN